MKKETKKNLSQSGQPLKSPAFKVHVSTSLPTDWQAWANEDAQWKVLVLNESTYKSSITQELGKVDPQLYDRASASTKKASKWLSELVSGFGTDEWNTPFIAFNQASAEKIAALPQKPNDTFGWLYVGEKLAEKGYEIQLPDLKTSKISFGQLFKAKWNQSIQWYFNFKQPAIHQSLFLIIALFTLISFAIMSRSAGISGDEFTQYEYSRLSANYYLDLIGADQPIDTLALKGQKMTVLAAQAKKLGSDLATIEDPERLMHLYGSSFDTFTTILAQLFGVKNIYDFRHLMNSIFGFFIIWFGALIIKRITGSWKYAWVGLLALFFTPRIMGEALNNPKDIPFAAGYVMAIYYLIKTFATGTRFRKSALLGLVTGIALAISIRVGGLILLPMVGLFAALQYIKFIGLKSFLSFKWNQLGPWLGTTVLIMIAGYFFGILPWPWGLSDPIGNPLKALKAFSNYSGSLRQLFEGVMYDSDLLPRHYLIKYILITTPLVSLLGALLFVAFRGWKFKQLNNLEFLLFFAAVFPVFYIWLQKSNVYGGLRHALFVIPCLVALGTIGFKLLEDFLRKFSWSKWSIPGISLAMTSLPAMFVVQSHPLQYVYFNETVGGVEGAYGKYEMDYYLASLRPSTEWFLENVARKNPKDTFVVLTYGMDQVKYYCRNDKNVKVGFTRYDERGNKKWDYAIFYNAYLDQYRLLNDKYPPKGTVFSPLVKGKPMGLVIKRQNLIDFQGYQKMSKQQFDSAAVLFKTYLKSDPNQNEIWLALCDAYNFGGKKDSAIWAANEAVKVYPEYTTAMYRMLEIHYQAKEWEKTIQACNNILEVRPKEEQAFFYRSISKAQKSDLTGAIADLFEAIKLAPLTPTYYQVGAQLQQASGNAAEASRYQNAIKDDLIKNEIYKELTGKNMPGVEE